MKRYKSYFFRIATSLVLGLILSFLGVQFGNPETNVLFTVYGIVFSVFVSFAVTFSSRNIRRPKSKRDVMSELSGLTNGAVLDFITISILYSVLVGLSTKTFTFSLWKAFLCVKLDTVFYLVILVFLCVMAYRFLKLRNLQDKLENYD